MRKWSIVVLVAAILVGAFFVVFHMRHHARPTITGIGVMLTMRDHALEVMGVLPDSPAAKAGLHSGLIIQQINGSDVAGRPLAECVAMTRGPVGSTVQLEVVDPAKSETNLVELTRVKFSLPVGNGKMRAVPVAH
jgi:carboxyl-terminal processing protease